MLDKMRKQLDIIFDGTFEGFLSVVHAYYYEGILPRSIQCIDAFQPSITQNEYFIVTSNDNAKKVATALSKKISTDARRNVQYAFLSSASDRYDLLFQYIITGFKIGHTIDNHLQNEIVLRTQKLAREVGREAHRYTGFCRFEETAQGIYYCGIDPVNHILSVLANHFTDRMMNQSWVIHDKKHHQAVVYDGHDCAFVNVNANQAPPMAAANEQEIQNLWTMYFNTLAIEARKNPKLHRQILPLRYRSEMTEFKHKNLMNNNV